MGYAFNGAYSVSGGRSSKDERPKTFRKVSVVPYKIGLPGASILPTSLMRPLSLSTPSVYSHFTPRIDSISILVIGCLYAIIDRVSSMAWDKLCFLSIPKYLSMYSHIRDESLVGNDRSFYYL